MHDSLGEEIPVSPVGGAYAVLAFKGHCQSSADRLLADNDVDRSVHQALFLKVQQGGFEFPHQMHDKEHPDQVLFFDLFQIRLGGGQADRFVA